tara:strand:+ start:152 stop:514 length:363 start_codon:yes stop_codon:yes gene_type:complete
MGCNCCKPLDKIEEEEVEKYARGIKEEHLRASILYYEWACERWKEAALRIACVRALEEARPITYLDRVKFLGKIPRRVLINESFQESLRNEWVETYIEGDDLRSIHDETSLNTALESIGF